MPSAETTVSLSIFTVPLYTLIAASVPVICTLATSNVPPATVTVAPAGLESRPSPFSLVSVIYKVPAVTSILPDNSYPFKSKVISADASNVSGTSRFWHKVRVPPVTDAISHASVKSV